MYLHSGISVDIQKYLLSGNCVERRWAFLKVIVQITQKTFFQIYVIKLILKSAYLQVIVLTLKSTYLQL